MTENCVRVEGYNKVTEASAHGNLDVRGILSNAQLPAAPKQGPTPPAPRAPTQSPRRTYPAIKEKQT